MSHSLQNIAVSLNANRHTFCISDLPISDFLHSLQLQNQLKIFKPNDFCEFEIPVSSNSDDFDLMFFGVKYSEVLPDNNSNVWNEIYLDFRASEDCNWIFQVTPLCSLKPVCVYKEFSKMVVQADDYETLKFVVLELLKSLHFPEDFIWEMAKKYDNRSIEVDFLRHYNVNFSEKAKLSLKNEIAKKIWENEQFLKEQYIDAAIHDLYFPNFYIKPNWHENFANANFLYADLFTQWVELSGDIATLLLFDENLNPINPLGKIMLSSGLYSAESLQFVKKMIKLRVSFEGQIFTLKHSFNDSGLNQAFGIIWTQNDEELEVEEKCKKLVDYLMQAMSFMDATQKKVIFLDGLGYLNHAVNLPLIQEVSNQLLSDLSENERDCLVRIGVNSMEQLDAMTDCCKQFFEKQFNDFRSEIDSLFLD